MNVVGGVDGGRVVGSNVVGGLVVRLVSGSMIFGLAGGLTWWRGG